MFWMNIPMIALGAVLVSLCLGAAVWTIRRRETDRGVADRETPEAKRTQWLRREVRRSSKYLAGRPAQTPGLTIQRGRPKSAPRRAKLLAVLHRLR